MFVGLSCLPIQNFCQADFIMGQFSWEPTFSDCVIKEERMTECKIKAGNQGVDFNGRLRKEKCGFNR